MLINLHKPRLTSDVMHFDMYWKTKSAKAGQERPKLLGEHCSNST